MTRIETRNGGDDRFMVDLTGANPEAGARTDGELCAAITDAIVQLYAEQLGKGPTRARTDLHNNVVVCVLEDVATVADQTLIERGMHDAAREVRGRLREALEHDLTRVVESETGRHVECLLSDYRPERDTAALVFVLEAT